jgi:hypothetical protein
MHGHIHVGLPRLALKMRLLLASKADIEKIKSRRETGNRAGKNALFRPRAPGVGWPLPTKDPRQGP